MAHTFFIRWPRFLAHYAQRRREHNLGGVGGDQTVASPAFLLPAPETEGRGEGGTPSSVSREWN